MSDDGAARAVGCLVRSKGATVLAGGLLGTALVWFITGRFRIILEKQGLTGADAPSIVGLLLDLRPLFIAEFQTIGQGGLQGGFREFIQ